MNKKPYTGDVIRFKTPAEMQEDACKTITEALGAIRVMSLGNRNNDEFRAALAGADGALKALIKFL